MNLPLLTENVVGPKSCKVAHSQGQLVARDLLDDIVLVVYAQSIKVGMMLRINGRPEDLAFAEPALRLFLSELATMGARRNQLQVHAIGGVPKDSAAVARLRHLLSLKGIRIGGCDLGASQNRSAWLSLPSGHLIVRSSTPVPCSDRLPSYLPQEIAS